MRKQFRETDHGPPATSGLIARSKMLVVVPGLSGKWKFFAEWARAYAVFVHGGLRSHGLGVKPSLDLFQQGSASFTGIAGGKLAAQFDHREPLARDLEGLLRGGGGGEIGTRQQEVKFRDTHQDQSVARMAGGLN